MSKPCGSARPIALLRRWLDLDAVLGSMAEVANDEGDGGEHHDAERDPEVPSDAVVDRADV